LPAVLDALGVLVLHVSLDGRVLGWNRAARTRLGWDGGVPGSHLDPVFAPGAATALARRIAQQGTVARDAEWGCADGRRVPVRVAADLEPHRDGPRLVCCATPRAEPVVDDPLQQTHDTLFTQSPQAVCVQD
jgi:PAS domain-containing protein